MSKTKPICVVYVPQTPSGNRVTWDMCEQITRDHNESMPDYHWFFFPANTYREIEFKVFYEKDFTPIKYEELKQLIQKAIEK